MRRRNVTDKGEQPKGREYFSLSRANIQPKDILTVRRVRIDLVDDSRTFPLEFCRWYLSLGLWPALYAPLTLYIAPNSELSTRARSDLHLFSYYERENWRDAMVRPNASSMSQRSELYQRCHRPTKLPRAIMHTHTYNDPHRYSSSKS